MGTAEVQVFLLSGDSRRTPTQGRRRSIVRTHPVRRTGPWGLAAGLERRCRARQGAQGSGCSALTPVRTSAGSWTRPGRARNPCLPGRSTQLPGTKLSAAQQGPGGRAGGARAACAAGSRTTWRTRSYPRRWAALPAGNLSTPGAVAALSSAGSESGSTRAPRGRDTVRGQMPAGIPALCLTTTSPAATPLPSVFADLLPFPPGLFPQQDSGGSIPRQDTYSR